MKNLTTYDKLKKLGKKKLVIASGIAVIGVIAIMVATGVKEESEPVIPQEHKNNMGDSRIETMVQQDAEETKYTGRDVKVALGTQVRLEPLKDASYIETVRQNQFAQLIVVDGDYALISHRDSDETYTRIGYVPLEKVEALTEYMFTSAVPCNRYTCFSENRVRIRNDMNEEHNSANILTNGEKGDYARVIATVKSPEWSDDEWFLVAYRGYIGYMHGRNGTFLTEEEMQTILSEKRSYLKITGNSINVRSNPSKGDNVVNHLNNGDVVVIIGESDEWYHTEVGYVSKEVPHTVYVATYMPEGLKSLHFDNFETKTR